MRKPLTLLRKPLALVRKPLAFLMRDIRIESSYHFSFAFQIVTIFLSVVSYYFLARFVEGRVISELDLYGGDYFAFILIGVALHNYLTTSLHAFSRSIRESQVAGTLEALVSTQTSLPTILLSSSLYPFVWTSCGVGVYLGLGVGLFGIQLASGSWLVAVSILMLSILVFSGFGILSASFILVLKRGSPVAWVFGELSWLLGGILYPVSVLPEWLQAFSACLPVTYAIEGMRAALLQGGSWPAVQASLGPLALFACIVLPVSLGSFQYATKHARMAGTLAQY